MSEHYDFHYQPTGSGAISGEQVLQQTEDAINELGDYVNDNVGGAMDVAQQALETAQTAETNAQTALDTANSFSGAIQSAQQDASTALSTAQTAQTTASNANNTAIQASQDASNAVTASGNAVTAVNTLSNTVTTLGQRVTTAEGNIGQNTSDITALTTRVGTAEGNITTLQNDVSIAQGNASSAMATAGTVKQQAYVLRYSSSSVTDNSTIAYSTLDNTDNVKTGDKVIDVDGKIFSVVSVDSVNSTVTVGSALIDLALDGNVVHTSGNETVGGVKTFTNDNLIKTSSPKVLLINTSQTGNTAPSSNTASSLRFDGGTVNNFGGVQCEFLTTGENRLSNYVYDITKAKVNTIQQRVNSTTAMTVFNADLLVPATDSVTALGNSSKHWSDVQTYKINGLEPSSLSMPDLANGIDISSYIDVSHVSINYYTPPANGWISISVISSVRDSIQIECSNGFRSGVYACTNPDDTNEYIASIIIPCIKNDTATIYFRSTVNTSMIKYAKFFPCQGNV